MTTFKSPLMLLALISFAFLIGCQKSPEDKTQKTLNDFLQSKIDPNLKFEVPIKTEYNPIPLSKSCNQKQSIKLKIPRPYPYRLFHSTVSDTIIHTVTVFINNKKIEEIEINHNFKNKFKSLQRYKWVEFQMPSFSDLNIENGDIKIELYAFNELIDQYTTKFYFLENGKNMKTIKRENPHVFSKQIKLDPSKKQFIPVGNYTDDLEHTSTIKKHEDHFEARHKVTGSSIYKISNTPDKKKTLIATLSPIPEMVSRIPLEFELEEKKETYNTFGTSGIRESDVGNEIVWNTYKENLGKHQTVEFKNCSMEIVNEEMIYTPIISGWGVLKE